MHEYLDLAAETGYFDDPRILYDLTPAEIAITIAGKPPATGSSARWRMFGPDGCGRGLQLAPAETNGPGMDLEGHLPGHDAKTAAVAGGDETTMQRNSTDIRWTVTTHGAERREPRSDTESG